MTLKYTKCCTTYTTWELLICRMGLVTSLRATVNWRKDWHQNECLMHAFLSEYKVGITCNSLIQPITCGISADRWLCSYKVGTCSCSGTHLIQHATSGTFLPSWTYQSQKIIHRTTSVKAITPKGSAVISNQIDCAFWWPLEYNWRQE